MKVGLRLDDNTELLLRQVNPAFVRDGRPSSQVFRPTPKDNGMVSVNRGSKRTAELAFQLFIARPACKSCGVLAVSVAECQVEQLAAHDAPLMADDDGYDDPTHAIIDYRGIAKSAAEKKAGRLVRVAEARGFLHGPIALAPVTDSPALTAMEPTLSGSPSAMIAPEDREN